MLHTLKNQAKSLLLAAPVAVFGGAVQADSVSLIWSSTNGAGITGSNTIAAAPGDELVLDVVLESGPTGIALYSVSVLFDVDLGNELNLNGAPIELLPAGFQFNVTPGVEAVVESDATTAGAVYSMEGATFAAGPVEESFLIGQIPFVVTDNVVSDGTDLSVGLFNEGVDGLFDNDSVAITEVQYGTASVQLVPVPSALWLFGSALLVVGARGRASRR